MLIASRDIDSIEDRRVVVETSEAAGISSMEPLYCLLVSSTASRRLLDGFVSCQGISPRENCCFVSQKSVLKQHVVQVVREHEALTTDAARVWPSSNDFNSTGSKIII